MARRPDFGRREDMMSRQDLKALAESLSRLSQPAVLDVYQKAYRDCQIAAPFLRRGLSRNLSRLGSS
jgi:hypothetical protein